MPGGDRALEPSTSFVIGEGVVDGGLVVLTPPEADVGGVTIERDAEVQVEGEVREFVVPDIEGDYDPFDLTDDLYVDYEEDNVIVADSVAPAPTEDGGNGENGGEGTTTTGS